MRRREKILFKNRQGVELAGLLELPNSGTQHFVLFAHCFTCGKDIAAASRIARFLVKEGFGVLRFDFTGLGNSDGDFSNTNFTSNVEDLVDAAEFLKKNYLAPELLIGHSLGGAAVLRAAHQISESLGVVTIGAPSEVAHIKTHFKCAMDEIKETGVAKVQLGERVFDIKEQFLEDIDRHPTLGISNLKKAILIMHAPFDQFVSIDHAEKIYQKANHPKSFISLDTADHLLSKKEDAEYVARCIGAWFSRFLQIESPVEKVETELPKGQVIVQEKDHHFTQHVWTDDHYWLADEPVSVGGENLGPDPYEHLLAALGACTAMTIRMVANRKKINLNDVKCELTYNSVHLKDCESCDETPTMKHVFERKITLVGDLSDTAVSLLSSIADKCPVHRTLTGEIDIKTTVQKK